MLEPRPSCHDCGRPLIAWVPAERFPTPRGAQEPVASPRVAIPGACFCDRITPLSTRARILLLQHPRERRMAIGTAKMAQLALPNSRLKSGLDFAEDRDVRAALADPSATFVLFPGPDALPAEDVPRDRDLTLIVLDGTWWQARKLLKLNPFLASLPRVGFRPRTPSAYLIRRQPADFCLSTIEALAEVLRVIEPDGARFERLLDPFHAMVARQRWFRDEIRSSRHRPFARRGTPRRSLAGRLDADWPRLVCVHGEANAWPRQLHARPAPETVHWVAYRPATSQTFEAVLAPRRVLAPATHQHIELPLERIHAGDTLPDWYEAWEKFTRPDDILVVWGAYYRDLAMGDGLPLGFPSIDLRTEASQLLRRRVGTLERSMGRLGATPALLDLPGRGGRRLALLAGALESLRVPRRRDP